MSATTATVDPVMVRIGEGIALGGRGERARARAVFEEVWGELGPDGDAFHRCALAHSMADVQDDVDRELHWDLLALAAADQISSDRARAAGVGDSVAGFYPSLHLNLGDAYRRVGDLARARQHLARGLAALEALPNDGYARLIRSGLDRLAERIGS